MYPNPTSVQNFDPRSTNRCAEAAKQAHQLAVEALQTQHSGDELAAERTHNALKSHYWKTGWHFTVLDPSTGGGHLFYDHRLPDEDPARSLTPSQNNAFLDRLLEAANANPYAEQGNPWHYEVHDDGSAWWVYRQLVDQTV